MLWSIDVPWSPSSPCIWGGRIFLTTFSDGELQTRGYDQRDGTLLWTRGSKAEKLEKFHPLDSSPAASTPACDGRHVVSYFGSLGVICHDRMGRELWRHPLPIAISGGSYGSGASPILVGKFVILSRDQDRDSSLLALDVTTGRTAWEAPRPDASGSFGTPVIWENQGRRQIIIPGAVHNLTIQWQTSEPFFWWRSAPGYEELLTAWVRARF